MQKQLGGELGQILISPGVVERLVLRVVAEQDELLPLNFAAGDEGIFEALAKTYKGSGVEISHEGEVLKVRLQLIARYGIKIPEAARRLMLRLRDQLNAVAGLEVPELELEIKGLRLPDSDAAGEG